MISYRTSDAPQVFATPRFTFPYSLVGRPFPLNGPFPKKYELPMDATPSLNKAFVFRQEYFGSIAFQQYSSDRFHYGNIVYLNQISSKILANIVGATSVQTIINEQLPQFQKETKQFLDQCHFLGLLNAKPSVTDELKWNESEWTNSEKQLKAPLRLYINLTERCNLACKYCYASAGKSRRELERKIIEDVFNQAKELKIPTIVLIGGEPLLYPLFSDVVKSATASGLSVFTATNGILLNKTNCEALRGAGLPIVGVSLDGPEANSHDAVRGSGMFNKTISGIENAIATGLDVSLSTTLTNETIENIDQFFELGHSKGVIDYHFMIVAPVGRGKDEINRIPSKKQLQSLREKLLNRYQSQKGITINCTGAIDPQFISDWHANFKGNEAAEFVYTGCEAGRFRMEIGFDGSFIPCILLDDPSLKLGKAGVDSIKEIWSTSNILQSLNNRSISNEDDFCKKCRAALYCRGGCRGVIHAHYGSVNHSDPTCTCKRGC